MIIKDYKEIDGIKIFHENVNENHNDYNSKGLDNLYTQEEKHFWFLARKSFIYQNFKKYIYINSRIIEIGAGTGNVSRYLQNNGYKNISVGEMHLNGLKYAKSYGIKNCYQFDLLDTPFENEFDAVCMFDVLEHISNDNQALQNVNKMLKKGGKIVLTLPSHMWLWNRDDAIAGHKIRYTKKDFIKKLENSGFEIIIARYFFIAITPLLFLRRVLNKDDGSEIKDEEYSNDISMNGTLSKILLFISNIENKINRFLPNLFGGSLFVIARKKNDTI
ncbi:class I SAM-dependent methyltransferase [Aliarcobacter butzleri]|uniref:class I SAM-dependent methyltransferase n=1 Tax=Aliarcobacter butzleri TaxID=28197 RepID=UPI00125EEA91|nr:class I SAM-dependent methyltransferase [Aliarcobacter butzleri]